MFRTLMQPICRATGILLPLMLLLIIPVPNMVAGLRFADQYQLTSFGSQPSLSPDGEEIVFVNYSTFGPAGYPTEIWAIGVDGSNSRLVLTTPEDMQASNLQFSPDGSRIAYIGEKFDGSRSIHVMNRDGSNNFSVQGTENVGAFVWSSNESIVYAVQDVENSIRFSQISLDSSHATLISRITMTDTSRFVVGRSMALTVNGTNLLFTGYGEGLGRSDIFSLNLETAELWKLDGFENFFLIDVGQDGNTVFVGQGSGYSTSIHISTLENPEEKTKLLDANMSYSVYESADKGLLVVAYAYAPGGSAPFDPDRWSRFGVYVACQDGCGPTSEVFSGGYVVRDGQYVRNSLGDTVIIAIATAVAVGVGGLVLYRRKSRKNRRIS